LERLSLFDDPTITDMMIKIGALQSQHSP